MAKQGYPGLVVVPPSDRELVKRRLARWTLLIVGILGSVSALNAWLPSADKTADCQPSLSVGVPPDSYEDCDRPNQSPTEAQSSPNNLVVADASQVTSQAEPPKPIPTPPPAANRLTTQQISKQAPPPAPSAPTRQALVRTMAPPQERPAPNRTAAKPTSNPNSSPSPSPSPNLSPNSNPNPNPSPNSNPSSNPIPDTHLAEQGDAFAQYRLGRFYAERGGPHTPESVSWYTKASAGLRHLAETGNGEAMYVLGVMYAFGRGVKQDTQEARRWLTQAIEHQVAAARPVLASLEKHRLAEGERTGHGG